MIDFWIFNVRSSMIYVAMTMTSVSLTMPTIIRIQGWGCTGMIGPKSSMKLFRSSQIGTCTVALSNIISNITPSSSLVVTVRRILLVLEIRFLVFLGNYYWFRISLHVWCKSTSCNYPPAGYNFKKTNLSIDKSSHNKSFVLVLLDNIGQRDVW